MADNKRIVCSVCQKTIVNKDAYVSFPPSKEVFRRYMHLACHTRLTKEVEQIIEENKKQI